MKLKQRMLSLLLGAAMLVTPVASMAEENVYAIPSGEVTTTAVNDAYVGGKQINLTADLALNAQDAQALAALLGLDEAQSEEKLAALSSIIDQCTLEMTFYDDFGTARISGDLKLGDVSLLSGTALIYEDGSAQVMTNLTGSLVLAAPAGTFRTGSFDLMSLLYGDFYVERDESVPFEELPADERLSITLTDSIVMVFSHLLGWVSATQMDTEELYVFDDTYIEATDTRDAVAQRMIGTIRTQDFTKLLWNIVTTLRDDQGLLQQAIADVLAQNGVTRYQVRQVVDSLLTEETIDPALDWVQPSGSIPDDGALCTLDDISYFFKKLWKSVDKIWHENTHETMSMIVSYDDYGGMVGFDAEVPLITESWPFEGDFTYSIKTDENWQRLHTSHGELQIYNNNRLVGDLSIQFGEDVDGVNANHFNGQLDVVNQDSGASRGVGVLSDLTFTTGTTETGNQTEAFEGQAALQARADGESQNLLQATVSGETTAQDDGFSIAANAGLNAANLLELTADVSVVSGEYEEIPFAGGEAIDLSNVTPEQLQKIQDEVAGKVAVLVLSLSQNASVMEAMLKLLN